MAQERHGTLSEVRDQLAVVIVTSLLFPPMWDPEIESRSHTEIEHSKHLYSLNHLASSNVFNFLLLLRTPIRKLRRIQGRKRKNYS